MQPVEWIDVSTWQGYPNYLQIKADGISGVITRVNEGTIRDGSLAWNWPRISAAGLSRGGYDFAYTANPATSEANDFLGDLRTVGGWASTDILVLDIEANSGNLSAKALQQWVLVWCETVMTATGIRPWVYSNLSFISTYLQNGSLAAYPLWLAEPSATSWPAAPKPWTSIIAWQRSFVGSVPGINGSVDIDAVVAPAPAPVPKPVPPAIIDDDMSTICTTLPDGTKIVADWTIDGAGTVWYRYSANDGPWEPATLPPCPVAAVSGTLSALIDTNYALWHVFATGTDGTRLHWYQPVAGGEWVPQPLPGASAPMPAKATATEVAQVDADVKAAEAQEQGDVAVVEGDIKALPEPATPGEVLALDSRVASVEADVLEGDGAIENVIKAKP
jgi:GH25 family lysozyme M1 (1,4-beta-N-acetylmuramidase)